MPAHDVQREDLVRACRALSAQQLTNGSAGNVSARLDEGFLITPSGARCDTVSPDVLVVVSGDGRHGAGVRPSSEWRFHRDIYLNRPEVNAVVHAHAPFCTALACARRDIPAFHYMIAVAGGTSIRCARYATFGTQTLSDNALAALRDRRACLLANHGMIALGADLETTVALAADVEELATQYWHALQVGEPVLLDDEQMAEVLARFQDYRRGTQ